ncbi:hypothetical protein [Nocardioides sp. CFH 31398]|uniref:hypothetical protein n=1 Tax=Nocardioides sp. CFH 31398 TaxID=2919579 RepID=UPI001F06B48D|nr:hypothetical protein [Nocardioides sp. CFH 31398]MCH1866251.1 hypothetical protein [Nocardioides sp. CFH 31398]
MNQAGLRVATSALAPLAVLAVLVAGAAAAVTYPGDDDPPTGPDEPTSTSAEGSSPASPTAPEGGQLVGGSAVDATVVVPEDGWTLADGTSIGYERPDGDGSVGTDSPALYDQGFCETEDGLTYRALAGFTDLPSARDVTVQDSAQDALDAWTGALGGGVGDAVVTPVRLDDGSAGWTGAQVVEVTEPETDCDPEARELRVVSVATDGDVATVVMLRDVRADGDDLRGGLSAADADDVLRTLTPTS